MLPIHYMKTGIVWNIHESWHDKKFYFDLIYLFFQETKLTNRKWRHLLVVVEVLELFTLDLITLAYKMKPCSSHTLEMKMKQSEQICHLNLFLEKKFGLHRLFFFFTTD